MGTIEPYKDIAELYERIRPGYPEELIQDMIKRTGLKPGSKLLDIGAGTGKATMQFAEKGYQIHAIELGKDMAQILKRKCSARLDGNVNVEIADFETWEPSGQECYDMIYSAQAFHWIDKNIKYRKCHQILKNNGCLALFWYNPSSKGLAETEAIEEQVKEITNRYFIGDNSQQQQKRRSHTGVVGQDERAVEIEASGLFDIVDRCTYSMVTSNDADNYLMVLKSVPEFVEKLERLNDEKSQQMEHEIREVVQNHGNQVKTVFQYTLYIARKI